MKPIVGALALVGALAVPGLAQAATSAIATADVNLRAGPATAYPVVTVVGSGNNVAVHGCLDNRSWCDVSYRGVRGWMSSNYIAYLETGPRYAAPVITFSFGNYWDNHYRGHRFYRDRDRYRHHDWRRDRRDDRRGDWRRDRRDDRRGDWRDDRRGDRRGDWRGDRRDDHRRDWPDGDRRDGDRRDGDRDQWRRY